MPDGTAFNHHPVERPAHYANQAIETIDYLESCLSSDEFIGFCKGNAIKYASRAGKKSGSPKAEDMRKAEWYSRRAALHAEKQTSGIKVPMGTAVQPQR